MFEDSASFLLRKPQAFWNKDLKLDAEVCGPTPMDDYLAPFVQRGFARREFERREFERREFIRRGFERSGFAQCEFEPRTTGICKKTRRDSGR